MNTYNDTGYLNDRYIEIFFKDIVPILISNPGITLKELRNRNRVSYDKNTEINIDQLIYYCSKVGLINKQKIGKSYRYKMYIDKPFHKEEMLEKIKEFFEIKDKVGASDIKHKIIVGNTEFIKYTSKDVYSLIFDRGSGVYNLLPYLSWGIIFRANDVFWKVINKYWKIEYEEEFKLFIRKYGFLSYNCFLDQRLWELAGDDWLEELRCELGKVKDNLYVEIGKFFMDNEDKREYSEYHFSTLTLVRAFLESLRFKLKEQPNIKNLKYNKCINCGKSFIPEEELQSTYRRFPVKESIFEVNFCNKCINYMSTKYMLNRSKEEMIKDLKDLVDMLGYVPPKDFSKIDLNSIPSVNLDIIMQILNRIMPYDWAFDSNNIHTYKKEFGSWLDTLVGCGILEKPSYKRERGYYCLAKDKHECYSLVEKTIDDWLFENNIKHEKEVHYPYDEDLNPNELLRTDWKVNGVYIEFWGLEQDEQYFRKILLKRTLCKKYGLKLFEICAKESILIPEKMRELLMILK